MTDPRDARLVRAFVRAAGTLLADEDPLDSLQHVVEDLADVLAVDAAAVLLGDHRGTLRLAAATSEGARVVEPAARQAEEGPCLDTFTSGRATLVPDLAARAPLWPSFVPAAAAAGFGAVHALPLRLRHQTLGVVALLTHEPGDLAGTDARTAQALVDIATVGVLHQRVTHDAEVLDEQLRSALATRVVVEQAKGVVAERHGVGVDEAFRLLRGHARAHGTSLLRTSAGIVTGTIATDQLTLLRS